MSWVKDVVEVVKETGTAVEKSGIIDKVASAVNSLASSLGVAAKHVYEVLARQAVVDSITNIIIYLIFFIFIIFFFKKADTCYKNHKENNTLDKYDLQSHDGLRIVGGFIGVILAIFFCSTITSTVTGFVNPEYKVIKEIAEVLRQQGDSSNGACK